MIAVSLAVQPRSHRNDSAPIWTNNKIWGDVIQNVTAQKERRIDNGLAIYQFTEKGLMLNADLAGTKYWLHDNLNE